MKQTFDGTESSQATAPPFQADSPTEVVTFPYECTAEFRNQQWTGVGEPMPVSEVQLLYLDPVKRFTYQFNAPGIGAQQEMASDEREQVPISSQIHDEPIDSRHAGTRPRKKEAPDAS